jgi:phosphoglycerate dehydrogenase-like enzyme
MENVIVTPHVAGVGPYGDERRLAIVLDNVRRFVGGQSLVNVADKQLWY